MNEKTRRSTPSSEDTVRILRLHLLEGKPISEICEAEGIPSNALLPVAEDILRKGNRRN